MPEQIRIHENHLGSLSVWDLWGPYVSERAWGTVREDYSLDGDAWNYFPHDMARSRAFRWGEDGIAGICDRYQVVTFSLAFWNHKDLILKERLFGVSPSEAQHGEDVKELYFHLDNCPSHAYMRYLYKYPQRAYPYEELISENKRRTKKDPEYEIYDTGIFDQNRYFDIFIEYAKIEPEEIVIRIEITNRSGESAILDVLPQLTFRNVWSWRPVETKMPLIKAGKEEGHYTSMVFDDFDSEAFPMLDIDYKIGRRYLYASPGAKRLFTNNETNFEKLGWGKNRTPFVKDAFHRHVINGEDGVNPEMEGTKAAFHYKDLQFSGKETKEILLRMSEVKLDDPLANVASYTEIRKKECEDYYNLITTEGASKEEREIQKAALSAQLWSRQIYLFIVNYWMKGDDQENPLPLTRQEIRNTHWKHLVSKHLLFMPDKWEYPWFAAWDLAFHVVTIAFYDITLAKDQLWILLTEQFQHPNGQIPAYEWEFSDLNPPIQAWALLKIFEMEKEKRGKADLEFMKKCFQKLLINFSWWVNREDARGNNIFEGGFLGLDNIAVIDRSKPLSNGGSIEQSDATGWMGAFCLAMMRISMILTKEDISYEPMITKFFQHFIYISTALNNSSSRKVQNWDEEDGFFYDVICYPDGRHEKIAVRSLVGIIPLFGVDSVSVEELRSFEKFYAHFTWFMENRQDLVRGAVTKIQKGEKDYYLLSLASPEQIKRVLARVWDPEEFRSDFGIRSLSKYHEKHPFRFLDHEVHYRPAESQIGMYGGNSNWRGPIWMPTNYLLIQTLSSLYEVLGDDFTIQVEGLEAVTLKEMAKTIGKSLVAIFQGGDKAVYNGKDIFKDPEMGRYLLFYEYYHGDTGSGLGSSHQTGWSALVANIIDEIHKM